MRSYLRPIICFTLAFIAFLLHLLSTQFPQLLLRFYSHSINRKTIQWLSRLTGLVPFSIFEWLLYILITSLIAAVILTIFKCTNHKHSRRRILKWFLLNIMSGAAIIYASFIFLWGLNYNRPPLANELQLQVLEYSPEDLTALVRLLTERTNTARLSVVEDRNGVFTTTKSHSQLFGRAALGFEALGEVLPFLSGTYGPPKAILSSSLMNYTFITGIYFPFTGEANVNVATPDTTLIFTTMHEMAHQRGIAREDEANFIAFLTSIAHPDADFKYAGYFNALNYARSALSQVAPERILELNTLLSDGVINDLNFRAEFWQRFQGPVEKTVTQMNEAYLRSNGVTEGVQSYGLVVDLLMAYFQDELNRDLD